MARYTFGRAVRLPDSVEFGKVFRSPVKSIDNSLVVLARRNGLGHARLGLSVAKKQIRQASDRNRIKRLARESFRHHQQALAGMDLIVVSRAGARRESNASITTLLERHWSRIAKKCKAS